MKRILCATVLLSFASTFGAAQERDAERAQVPFQSLFTLRGIELTKDQQRRLDEFREQYTPQLVEIQRQSNGIYTPQQRRDRRAALEAARSAGKQGRELQQAGEQALQLTDQQQTKLAANQKQRDDLVAKIQSEVRALLTAAQRRQLQRQGDRGAAQNRGPAVRPTHRDVKYGPHERNVMDVWLAESDEPTPVLVSIHGGGFRGGNKSVAGDLLQQCLDSGISVVAITYRLSDVAIAPAQFYDAARAIQFVRHNAVDWNLDAERIAATGGSAGAGLSLWLGFHGDLGDPESEDPVLQHSTRLTCMSVFNGQTSYDPRFIRDLFPGTDTYQHQALALLYDVDLKQLDNLPREKYELFELVSPINHLTKDDVPAQLLYASQLDTPITSQGVGIHHPRFGQTLKAEMDKLGIECQVHTGVERGGQSTELTLDFVKQHFGIE